MGREARGGRDGPASAAGAPVGVRPPGRRTGAARRTPRARSPARRLLDEAGSAAVVNLLRDLGEGVDFEAAFLHRIQRTFVNWVIE